jgi:hypothetical protein
MRFSSFGALELVMAGRYEVISHFQRPLVKNCVH